METGGFVVREGCESRSITIADAQRVTVSGRRPGAETNPRRKTKSSHEAHTGGEVDAGSKESGHDEASGSKSCQHAKATDAAYANQNSLGLVCFWSSFPS